MADNIAIKKESVSSTSNLTLSKSLPANSSNEIGRQSYTLRAWERLRSVCIALRQTEDKVHNLKSEIEIKLKNTERLREKRAELQACRMSVDTLESQLDCHRAKARTASAKLNKMRHRAADSQFRLEAFRAEIEDIRSDLTEKQRYYISSREKIIWSAAQLLMRRRQMVQELRFIFPMEPYKPSISNAKSSSMGSVSCSCKSPLKVINFHLPDSEDYYGHNDIDLAVGINYVLQVLVSLSKIFDFPLRYRVDFLGTGAVVYDFINPHLLENQKKFPLFCRFQDKIAFQYGVFLLNKNLAQLRCDCGLSTKDLRCTLENLRSLCDYLADTKLEPYLYVTRPIRLAVDDPASSTSCVPHQSPSTSSARSSDESRKSEPVSSVPLNDSVFPKSDFLHNGADGNSAADFSQPSSVDDGYVYKYTSDKGENAMETAASAISKEVLKTCYFSPEDEDEQICADFRKVNLVSTNGIG